MYVNLNFLWTPLHYAARDGHFSVVEYLVHHGADIEAKTIEDKTPYTMAYEEQRFDVCEFLKNKEEETKNKGCRI